VTWIVYEFVVVIDVIIVVCLQTSVSSFVSPSRTKNSPGEVMEETDSGISTNINNELHGKVIKIHFWFLKPPQDFSFF